MSEAKPTANLKPYPEYKDSGLPWLGQIPAHWDAHNLRTLITAKSERNRPDLPLLSVVREKGVIRRNMMGDDENHNYIPDDLSNYKVVRKGNLVINKMKAWQGSLGIAPCDGIVSPAYFVFDFRMTNSAFGHILLRSRPYVAHFARASDGVRIGQWDLSIAGMRQIPVVVPEAEEQAAIVRFLDHANRQVDRYIRVKKRMIALLNEQKQAIIHHAVTRGLDPNVPLKPSGISWLGDIPAHWSIIPNRQLFRETTRKYLGENEIALSLSQRNGLVATNEMKEKSLLTASYDNFKVCIPGDLVLNRFKAHLGVFFAATLRGIVTFHYGVFRPIVEMQTKYYELLYHTTPYKTIYAGASNGMTVGLQNLSNQNFYKVKSITPPLTEQIDIIRFLESETSLFNQAISAIEREITLMREYRTRLIADVVTGQLDVRTAAHLPAATDLSTTTDADISFTDEEELTADDLDLTSEEIAP